MKYSKCRDEADDSMQRCNGLLIQISPLSLFFYFFSTYLFFFLNLSFSLYLSFSITLYPFINLFNILYFSNLPFLHTFRDIQKKAVVYFFQAQIDLYFSLFLFLSLSFLYSNDISPLIISLSLPIRTFSNDDDDDDGDDEDDDDDDNDDDDDDDNDDD